MFNPFTPSQAQTSASEGLYTNTAKTDLTSKGRTSAETTYTIAKVQDEISALKTVR